MNQDPSERLGQGRFLAVSRGELELIISIVSYKGGVGKTTMAANLAINLRRMLPSVSAIDLDDQNALRLHFGSPPAAKHGIAACDSKEQWQHVVHKSSSGVMVYPFGHVSPSRRLQFQYLLQTQDSPLNAWLRSIGNDELVLIDTPPGDNPAVRQSIMMADILLVVLNTNGASFATIGLMDELVQDVRPELLSQGKMYYLLTDYDERSEMEHAVHAAVCRTCAGRVAPVVIHHDEALVESFVCQCLLREYNIHSQSLLEFEQLSRWLLEKMQQSYPL